MTCTPINFRHSSTGSKPLLAMLMALCVLLCVSSSVWARSVSVEVVSEEVIVGEAVSFALKFEVDSDDEIIDVSQVRYNGAPIAYEIRSQSSSSFTMIVNGKTVRSSSGFIKNYIFSLPTTEAGQLTLPAFTVSLGSKEYKVQPLTFTVTEKPTSDDLQFIVQLTNPQAEYYPSQVIDLECSILYRNFQGSPSIENISLPILKNLSFELLADPKPNFEMVLNNQRQTVRQQQGTQVYQGKRYNSLTFHLKFRLMNPGEFSFANSLKMLVETGRRYRKPSLFFGYDLAMETKPIFADSKPLLISVRELPKDNVPNSFNGAIGNFKIQVTPSSDTAIRVGDPITLHVEISGRGTWEFVKSPPIEREAKITDYFIVSEEPVLGELNEAQTAKSFSVRLRVKSKTVNEIPAIPFTYFNLATRKYVTVYSEPVPIKVFEAAAPAQITDFSAPKNDTQEKNGSDQADDQGTSESPGNGKQAAGQAPTQPIMPPLIEISDNVAYEATTDNHAPVYTKLIFAVVPLALTFLFYLVVLYRGRDISAEKNAQLRSKKAQAIFLAELDTLSKKDQNLTSFCTELGRNIHQFLEDRCACKFPYLSRETLMPLVESGKLQADFLHTLMGLIEKIDQKRYGAAELTKDEARQLLKEAKEAIKTCK